MENLERKYTLNYQLYEIDKNYKDRTNLIEYINQSQNFVNGNQYPNANFNNMIRVTMNICDFATRIKASKICGTPIYLTYTADNNETDCVSLQRFDEYNCKKISLDKENYQAALNGYNNGTEITFIRWDDDDMSYKGIYKGGLCEEHIDARNFAVANPYIQDIQNQKWVMYYEETEIGALKELVEGTEEEKKKKIENLNSEGKLDQDLYIDEDVINHRLTPLFTRFFRVDGEVYFTCETKNVSLFKYPHSLSRKLSKSKIKKVVEEYLKSLDEERTDDSQVQDYKIDYEEVIITSYDEDKYTDEEYKEEKEKFYLYPFAVFEPLPENRSFFGRSDVRSLIPIQKGLNFILSMLLKCAENNAYNKIFAKEDALGDQIITNEPGQVIIDYSSFTNGWGIKMAESQPMPNGLMSFANELLNMTRIVYGFDQVMNGDISKTSDMSGYMLQQMINQSNTTIEQQQKLFWKYNEEKAQIRLLYYKHYVDKAKYSYELSDAEFEEEERSRNALLGKLDQDGNLETMPNANVDELRKKLNKETNRTQIREINNEEIYGVNFDISIEAMQGLSDSKLIESQFWDNLLLNGALNNMDPEMFALYVKVNPNISPRTKASLNKIIENLKYSKIKQLESELQNATETLAQITDYTKQLESRMGYQSEFVKNLQKEFEEKINVANKVNQDYAKQIEIMQNNAALSQGEVKSNNSRGIDGSKTEQA